MSLDWMPRDNEIKDHTLHRNPHWGTQAPCTMFEKKPLVDPNGEMVEGLFTAWITLNNPKQYNSYTTALLSKINSNSDF